MMSSVRFLWLSSFLWLGCSRNDCVLDDDLRLFTGDGALDCGTAGPAKDRADVDKCAADAFDAGKPFIARYERMGVASKIVNAVGSNTDGKVKVFRWDSAPCGGDACSAVTDVQSCDGPTLNMDISTDPTALPISCASLGTPQRICGG
jgi:hypothetical protein